MTFSRLVIEVQAVRIYLLSAVALSLTLAGCQMPSRGGGSGSGSARSGGTPAPFLGTPTNNSSPSLSMDRGGALTSGGSAPSGSTSTNREGVLAGRILDQDNRLRPGAIIQVIDLEHSREGAPLSVLANREGYFDINGLQVGHSYRLVARVKDSGRSLVGTARVVAPNVRVAIFLSEDAVGEDPTPAATASTEPKPGNGPTASLGPPTKNPGGVTTPLPGSDLPAPHPPAVTTTPGPTAPSASPDLIADKGKKPGEDGLPGEAPRVSVPSATPPPGGEHVPEKPSATEMPPPPPGATPSEVPPPPAAPPVEAARTGLPPSRTVIPSCVRVGQRVENFTLYDVKGKPFEFTKDRKGKLVLLDFWFTECPPCRKAIPKMNFLYNKYGRDGLEVIGVTCEQGTLVEKQNTLEQARRKYGLSFNYRLLFGGSTGTRACPVSEQLEVSRFPTLVLLDQSGRILWRGQGAGEQAMYELETIIWNTLYKQPLAAGR